MKNILTALTSLTLATVSLAEKPCYGVIEIGAKGIKPLVVQLQDDGIPKPVFEPREFEIKNKEPYKADKDKSIAGQVSMEINSMRQQIRSKFGAGTEVFVVQSSGVPEAVRTALQDKLPADITPDQMDVDREARLVFQGIVPPNRLNLGEVVVLDIGSGNSKGAYLTDSRNPLSPGSYETFSLPYGTGTFAKKVGELRAPGQEFKTAADMLARDAIQQPLETMVKQKKGMAECTRLYLAGGLPWVMTTLLHPELIGSKDPHDKTGKKNSDWVAVKAADINEFYNRAVNRPDDLYKVNLDGVKPENRAKAEEEVARAKGIFKEPTDLIAGAILLKSFMDSMNFDKKDAIFFSRAALYAWPQGYVREKFSRAR